VRKGNEVPKRDWGWSVLVKRGGVGSKEVCEIWLGAMLEDQWSPHPVSYCRGHSWCDLDEGISVGVGFVKEERGCKVGRVQRDAKGRQVSVVSVTPGLRIVRACWS
jgi:hypothetical protein